MISALILCLVLLSSFAILADSALTKVDREMVGHDWRHVEYCEILSTRNRMGWSHLLDFTAYNTVTLGCDREKWKDVTPALVRGVDGGIIVRLNGPRGWAFDDVSSNSALVDASITNINGIDMVVVGIVEATLSEIFMNLFFKQTTLYNERQVRRKTEYIFRAGKPLHYLQSPQNKTYAMQSYAKFIYPVGEVNLPLIGEILKLPAGWTYNTVILAEDLHVVAENAIGVIVQDDFQNVYSRFDSSLLKVASRVDPPENAKSIKSSEL